MRFKFALSFAIGLISICVAAPARAALNEPMYFGQNDVVVPLIHGDPSGNDLVSGMLYYNTSSSTFYGIDNNGSKVTLGVTGSSAVVSGGSERIERARIVCSSSSSISSQSGSWLSSVSNISSGTCTVTIAAGMFSGNPTCVSSADQANSGAAYGSQTAVSSTTSFSVTLAYNTGSTTSAATASTVNVICMGPR